MKYEKCLSCDQLGITCDGPNLLAMDTVELGLWCNELRKDNPGMTYDKIAAETELSKSAVRDFLTGKHDDCSMRTARTLARYITNGKWDDNPCGNLTNSERAAYEERIKQLEKDKVWHEDKIKSLEKQVEAMQTLITNTNARATQDKEFLRKQLNDRYHFLKRKDKCIVILSVLLGLCVLLIITALIIDRTNSGIGFIWLESLFKPHSINEILQHWNT